MTRRHCHTRRAHCAVQHWQCCTAVSLTRCGVCALHRWRWLRRRGCHRNDPAPILAAQSNIPSLKVASASALKAATTASLPLLAKIIVYRASRAQRAKRITTRLAAERATGQLERELRRCGIVVSPRSALAVIGKGYGAPGTRSGKASTVTKLLPPTRHIARVLAKHMPVVFIDEYMYVPRGPPSRTTRPVLRLAVRHSARRPFAGAQVVPNLSTLLGKGRPPTPQTAAAKKQHSEWSPRHLASPAAVPHDTESVSMTPRRVWRREATTKKPPTTPRKQQKPTTTPRKKQKPPSTPENQRAGRQGLAKGATGHAIAVARFTSGSSPSRVGLFPEPICKAVCCARCESVRSHRRSAVPLSPSDSDDLTRCAVVQAR